MADSDFPRELVTIASFRLLSQATVAEGLLDSAGIECFLQDDNTGSMLGFAADVIGGVTLKVNKIDADTAATLLGQSNTESLDISAEDTEKQLRCPKCYSEEITFSEVDEKGASVSGSWLRVPLPVRKRIGQCKSCGYRWDDEDN